jgi:26S proteasome regulatory subunit N1
MSQQTDKKNPPAAPPKDAKAKGDGPANKNAKGKEKEPELTEEDIREKEEIELLATRIMDPSPGVQKLALETLRGKIRTATSSMTSLPRPLKFLRPAYANLKENFEKVAEVENRKILADILSVLAMTYARTERATRDSLNFKLKGNALELEAWGHEYVRSLTGELTAEFASRTTAKPPQPVDELNAIIEKIVQFDMKHNAEPDACDLLMEVDQLPRIVENVDKANANRVCLYLLSVANYLPEPDDSNTLRIVVKIYRKFNQLPDAIRIALRLNDKDLITEIFESSADQTQKKQLAFILGSHKYFLATEDANVVDLTSNAKLSEYYAHLTRDLDVVEAKTPEDIYKQHLVETRTQQFQQVDSARANLASTYVNAFVNAGFGHDKLMSDESNNWLYKNKEHGMLAAAASYGMLLLWNVDELTKIDKFLHSREDYIKAGALLGIGLINTSVRNDCDPALALLSEHVESQSESMRISAILGLGLAYAGTAREDLLQLLTPTLEDSKSSMELASLTALALGMIFVGTCNADITGSVVQVFFERDDTALGSTYSRFLCLGLGLLYLGRQEVADVTLETLKALQEKPIAKYAAFTVETCAYAGTGNVLRVQKMLQTCSDHLEKDNGFQAVAVLGIALIAMGEDLGSDMSLRTFDHLLQYGEPVIRRAVPLGLGLMHLSNPVVGVTDTLSKLSHDGDEEVAQNAILALGLIGAGTNNARIAGLLRQLSAYYYKNQLTLFVVRIAQGLLHMGKGTMTLNPIHSDRYLARPTSLAGILAVMHAGLDMKNIILGKSHYLLYLLAPAIHPRMLMTFDESLKPIQVPVRVGQAVDTVGQAGRPKTITGFQTHTTPVLLGFGERAELATDEYLPFTSILEGFVILKPNPDASPKI